MSMAMIMMVISSGLSMLIASSAWVLAKQSGFDNEKMTPFECGFDPLKSARVPFSVRFFLLAILFLVFDVEIVLFLPVLGSLLLPNYSMLVGGIFFLFLVLVGLIYEWWEGALGWIS